MNNRVPNLEDHIGVLESLAYNKHYDLDLFDAPNIVLRPNGSGTHSADLMPTIYGDYNHDDEQFWFEPRMEFPKILKDNQWRGNYHSYLEDWAQAAKLADYLLETSWSLED